MTFADKRLRVIARKYSRICDPKTVGHTTCADGKDFWTVAPRSRSAIESTIFAALKEAAQRRSA